MKKIVTLVLLGCNMQLSAQKIPFSSSLNSDSITLSLKMKGLAEHVLVLYRDDNPARYFEKLFRYQIVAQQYRNALLSLDSLKNPLVVLTKATDPAFGLSYETFARAKLAQEAKNISFEDAYTASIDTLYNALSTGTIGKAENYFEADLLQLKNNFYKILKSEEGKDSVTLQVAKDITGAYSSYIVYAQGQPLAKTFFAKVERKNFEFNDSVLLKMPDGGMLSIAFYRDRKVDTPQPVVLLYNIYAGTEPTDCKFAVKHGYVGVVANTRGKRLSPDDLEPFEHDAKDAYYIIDWISKQPWCNGKVGMYGGSYLGFAQWSATKNLHPALKTIVPQAAAAPGIDFPVFNGIMQTYLLRYLHFVLDNKLMDAAGFFNNGKWNGVAGDWYKKGASFRSLDTLEGRPNAIFQRLLKHPSFDKYWQNTIPQREEYARINIPILHTTGYYDDDQVGAMYYYKQYHLWNKHPNDYLLIGPFDHGGSQYVPSKMLGGYRIDSVAQISIIDIVFEWFDYVLKDGKRPDILKDRVNFQVMGTNQWKHVSKLSQMHNDSLQFYLGNQLSGKSYPLVKDKPLQRAFIAQEVDMTERDDLRFRQSDVMVPTKLVHSTLLPEKEKLVFVSDPVDGSFAISGAIDAAIDLSVNKKDIDLVLDLYELKPDGKYFALTESLQRASLAKDNTTRHLLQPGKKVTINLKNNFIVSKQLEKGSRIVVVLGLNKSPNFQVNYGTGKDVSDETMADAKVPFKIKWYSSSRITIPILRL